MVQSAGPHSNRGMHLWAAPAAAHSHIRRWQAALQTAQHRYNKTTSAPACASLPPGSTHRHAKLLDDGGLGQLSAAGVVRVLLDPGIQPAGWGRPAQRGAGPVGAQGGESRRAVPGAGSISRSQPGTARLQPSLQVHACPTHQSKLLTWFHRSGYTLNSACAGRASKPGCLRSGVGRPAGKALGRGPVRQKGAAGVAQQSCCRGLLRPCAEACHPTQRGVLTRKVQLAVLADLHKVAAVVGSHGEGVGGQACRQRQGSGKLLGPRGF